MPSSKHHYAMSAGSNVWKIYRREADFALDPPIRRVMTDNIQRTLEDMDWRLANPTQPETEGE